MSKSKLVVYNRHKIALLGRVISVLSLWETGRIVLYYPHLVFRTRTSGEILSVVGDFANNLVFPGLSFIKPWPWQVKMTQSSFEVGKHKRLDMAKGFANSLAVFENED